MADLNELQQSVEWLGARLTKVEDRVDRLYAQARIFTINSQALEDKWLGMGEQAGPGQMAAQGGGEAWLEEVTKALGVVWPLPRQEHGFFLQMVKEVLGARRGGGLLFCPVLTQSWDPLWLGAEAHTNNTGELGSMPLANTSMFTTRIHPGFRGHNTI